MRRGNGGGRIGRRWTLPRSRHEGEPLVKRWIGAGRRRASRPSRDEPGAGAEIVVLTWAQTFGRDTQFPRADTGRGKSGRGKSGDGSGGIVILGEGKPGS